MISSSEERQNKYLQLYEIFYKKIVSGEWKDGQKIEPERSLCELYSVSRTTVRQTLNLLEQKGMVVRRQGQGTFVHSKPMEQKLTKLYRLRDQFQKMGIQNRSEVLTFEVLRADEALSRAMKIQINIPVIKIVRVFYAKNTPYVLETNWLPASLFPNLTREMVSDLGLYNSFSCEGVHIHHAVEQMKPVLVGNDNAPYLDVSPSDPAMLIERTSYSFSSEVVEFTRSIVRSDFFVYTVDLD